MSKHIANYVGISSALDFKSNGNNGFWNLIDQYFFKGRGEWLANIPPEISGGIESTPGNGYTYQTFISPGTLTVGITKTFDILVIGGGGAGGSPSGGGGGAGGFVYASGVPLQFDFYDIVVGSGGVSNSSIGQDSYIYSPLSADNILLAKGGGNGGTPTSAGGSGVGAYPLLPTGGPATQPGITQSISTTSNVGFPGGVAGSTPYPSGPNGTITYRGGGGGAGETAGPQGQGGDGKLPTPDYLDFYGPNIGVPGLAPLNGYFAGGGGGSGSGNNVPAPALVPALVGGLGGGGRGGYGGITYSNVPYSSPGGVAGVTNSGAGGGGGSPPAGGGAGGSGIIVLRYPV